ncbi:GATA transcription factor [Parasponia andersonii]|uniref:GATA transcription factor n=1 Tax=Parasponia andersonii TaxID=3476 RepID=A0A2P5DE15_PARAD|nr:GATA transcription factor [Parasponia andersonii]
MECVEGALKTSFRKEMAMKPAPQAVFDDLLGLNGQNGVSSDDFFVDDLLNFSNEDEPEVVEEEQEEEEHKGLASAFPLKPHKTEPVQENSNPTSTSFSPNDEFGPVPTTELSVPADELANLEWLSHFVEDSFSEFSTPYLAGVSTEKPKNPTGKQHQEPERSVPEKPCSKARSKRARTGGRVWSLGSPSFTESSSSSTSSSSSSPSCSWFVYPTQNPDPAGSVEKPPAKKPKKKPSLDFSGPGMGQPTRRCSHCGVQKTPQWRTGPLGAKTLCNACGVRFKSGRLLPEYRPACSPTFSSELHSNHHRKVLEMRRKKENVTGPESGFEPPVVPSF